MSPRVIAVIAFGVAALASPARARADDRSEAEALFRAGEKAFDATQYAAAADAFEQAYAKLPLPAIAFSLAQAQRLQYFVDNQPQHLERAVALYHAYIAAQKTGGRVADAVANLAQIEPLLVDLARTGATKTVALPPDKATRIFVVADVPKAAVTIDGEAGVAPFMHEVTEGDHTVVVSADGYETVTRREHAVAGEMLPVEVELPPKSALLEVTAPVGAFVTVDSRPVGDVPVLHLQLPAGRHVVAIGERGRVAYTREHDLARGQMLQLAPTLRPTTQRRAADLVFLGGAGLIVATGVAGGLAWSASSDASDKAAALAKGNASPDLITQYNRDLTNRSSRLEATEILGVSAGVVVLTGALLYLIDNPTPEAPPVAPISPIVGAKSAGIAFGGRF